jgi:hypothetical protein
MALDHRLDVYPEYPDSRHTDNLRFAFNTCLFDTTNATDPLSTSCSTDAVCGPLEAALEDGMQNPSIMPEFSYCSAYDNSFLGSFLSTCTHCLRESDDQVYLANCKFLSILPNQSDENGSPRRAPGWLPTATTGRCPDRCK